MGKRSRIIVLLGFFVLLSDAVTAATITAVANGNWSSNSTWSCNCQPTSSDNIVIPAGITVTSTGPVILFLGPVITITISGTLVLNNGSLQVDASDVITVKPGGKISGTGLTGGQVYSGVIPIFIANGSSINGPSTITSGSLPITLLFFNGQVQGEVVSLTWASATEENLDYYAVQRSNDGLQFETLSLISGAGTSTTRHDYSFTDSAPLPGTQYYRLMSVDKDGSSSYYHVINVVVNEGERAIELFPNPVAGTSVTVKLNFTPGSGVLGLYDSHGREVMTRLLSVTENQYTFELPGERNVFYIVMVKTATETWRSKIIVN
jgi:hypothetical protein